MLPPPLPRRSPPHASLRLTRAVAASLCCTRELRRGRAAVGAGLRHRPASPRGRAAVAASLRCARELCHGRAAAGACLRRGPAPLAGEPPPQARASAARVPSQRAGLPPSHARAAAAATLSAAGGPPPPPCARRGRELRRGRAAPGRTAWEEEEDDKWGPLVLEIGGESSWEGWDDTRGSVIKSKDFRFFSQRISHNTTVFS
ncbi:hypothetical protein PAHAL_1G318900 [Panicum hallii]|uniref:Uncharacterized protein n=1 Tax=Panicum hallii TaxID=206008 RepID=A0A2T8KWY4_9POAL|nr:hypothetical protein PAHAL_1G318900 [Panicum hallii]